MQREKAWKVFQYPCIGMYSFIDFSISKHEKYADVLERVKSGETLLDLACGFGQDIRKLVFDGAPPENVAGSELEQSFIDGGYDLFRDRDSLKSKITAGDFFSEDWAGLKALLFDIVYAANFFHLFSWDEQVETATRAVSLLKPKAGSMLFGRQTGVEKAGSIKHPATRSGEMYRHNGDSLKKMFEEVAEKLGTELDIEVSAAAKKAGAKWTMLMFTVTRK